MGVGYLHRFQGCLLPHTNSQSVQEVHAFSSPASVLPVHSTTLWPVHSSNGVHSGDQRGQTDGFTEGYKYLDDWLVRATSHQTCFQHTQTLVALCREIGWLVNKEKSELDPKFRRLPVRPERGQVQTLPRLLAGLNRQDSVNIVRSGVSRPAVYIPHRSTHSNRIASPSRSAPYETFTWHNWKVPE